MRLAASPPATSFGTHWSSKPLRAECQGLCQAECKIAPQWTITWSKGASFSVKIA